MDFVGALINVLAIIGIIVAGAFVVVFLGDLFLSIIDGNSGMFFKKKSNKEKEAEFEKFNNNLNNEKDEVKLLNDAFVDNNKEEVKLLNNVNEEEAEKEREMLFNDEPVNFNNGDLLKTEQGEDEAKKLLEEVNRKYLEEQALKDNNYEDEDFEFENLFEDEEENKEEAVEEKVEEKVEETPVEENKQAIQNFVFEDNYDFNEDKKVLLDEMERLKNELEEEKSIIANMRQSLQQGSDKLAMIEEINSIKQNIQNERKELEILRELKNNNFIYETKPSIKETEKEVFIEKPEVDYKAQLDYINSLLAKKDEEINKLKEENEVKDKLIKESADQKVIVKEVPVEVEKEPAPVVNNFVVTLEGKTKAEYEEKLAQLEEKLKQNEKELRVSKKEFIPLRRVYNTLKNDEVKLRRREAIVAKQKVMLYGVNNIAEIDEEKAKKLSEDLDLLDGLRLSVQHCKEVMEANKDRYPILERNYTILKDANTELKEQIEEVNKMLAKFDESAEEAQNIVDDVKENEDLNVEKVVTEENENVIAENAEEINKTIEEIKEETTKNESSTETNENSEN